jgi:hypothetical protein
MHLTKSGFHTDQLARGFEAVGRLKRQHAISDRQIAGVRGDHYVDLRLDIFVLPQLQHEGEIEIRFHGTGGRRPNDRRFKRGEQLQSLLSQCRRPVAIHRWLRAGDRVDEALECGEIRLVARRDTRLEL